MSAESVDKDRKTCGIYALIDPHTRDVRYIGASTWIERRIGQHLSKAIGIIKREQWIQRLKQQDKRLEWIVLERCTAGQLISREACWINTALDLGWPLVNTALPNRRGRLDLILS